MLWLVSITYFVTICALVCCGHDKNVPTNYILLAVFTFCVSWLVSFTAMRYDPIVVIEAIALTAAITIAVTCYAITTKNDFTIFGPILWIVGWIFVTMWILAGPLGYEWSGNLIWCGIGAFIFSFYLLIDTQMIMSGATSMSRKYEINSDSYILAAVMLYLDIINFFLYILRILGSKK